MTQGDPNSPGYQSPSVPPAGAVPPPPGGAPVQYQSAVPAVETNPDARMFGMLAHISSLAGFIIPFGNVIGPLVIWMMKKDQHPFVNDQGKESLNFQITATIAILIAVATICIGIGIVLAPLVGIAVAVMSIIAGIKANEGIPYRYPFTLRLIK
jgi:uncharacterized Tic20 family protein